MGYDYIAHSSFLEPYQFICIFEGTAFPGGTSPKFTTNLFNIKKHLRLILKMKFPEKIHSFQNFQTKLN